MLKVLSSIWNTTVSGETFSRWRSIGRLLALLCMCACMSICVCVHTCGRVFKGMLKSFFSLFLFPPCHEMTKPPLPYTPATGSVP